MLVELRAWARTQTDRHPEVRRIGVFGSYARGDYAPGSDLDVLILVGDSPEPRWFMRSAAFDADDLPVGADVFVYTEAEAARMSEAGGWMRGILSEAVWL